MRNRYHDLLQRYHSEILAVCPYYPALLTVAAAEFARLWKPGYSVLELGCGEGHTALPLLKATEARVALLDVSGLMIVRCQDALRQFNQRTQFIQADAYDYLRRARSHRIIYTGWTLHNFTQKARERLLRTIHANLTPGGTFMLMDKVYPGSGTSTLLERQLARYRYLPPDVRRAIVAHEREDARDTYRMDERPLRELLKRVGFVDITVHDRVERDIVLTARKRR